MNQELNVSLGLTRGSEGRRGGIRAVVLQLWQIQPTGKWLNYGV